MKIEIFSLIVLLQIGALVAMAQTTEIAYQGSLQSAGTPAGGNYDFEFRLYDALTGDVQIGPAVSRANTAVLNGSFSVSLDFGSAFTGADRFLEIRVRPTGGGGFTILEPRNRIKSTPHAIQSLNAANAANATNAATAGNALQLNGVAANQYVVTGDPRMSDARAPSPGSANYIQNQNSGAQAASNFSISGTGTANILNAATHYSIAGNRVMSITGANNFFVGTNSGGANTTGHSNSFFGLEAGQNNNTGDSNSFFGFRAGQANTSGFGNAFFGRLTGMQNIDGSFNSFFGQTAGQKNTTGWNNSFFGMGAGTDNTTGSGNSFFGRSAGSSNMIGENNVFFGHSAGLLNNSSFNTFLGYYAGRFNVSGTDNTFVGYVAGESVTGSDNTLMGSDAGGATTTGSNNTFVGSDSGDGNTIGSSNTTLGRSSDVGSGDLTFATAIGANSRVSNSNSVALGRPGGEDTVRIPGNMIVTGATTMNGNLVFGSGGVALFASPITLSSSGLGTAGGTSLCRNSSSQIAFCSSSLRYKTNVNRSSIGLGLIKQLEPITFDWKDGGMHDLGLGAEDVAAIEPLLVTYNEMGQVEGVKYDRIGVVLINAVKEQQKQIEAGQKTILDLKESVAEQAKTIKDQQTQLSTLNKIVCTIKPTDVLCISPK